ncbi:MAG: serine/threonine-protein kinase [Acidobacteria bacterium]|nr:serine/threonine-protein kinase [Acidobacteriota bacterium]
MSSAEWNKIDELFHAALEREPAAREGFLRAECGTDRALFEEVRSLVAALEDDRAFLEKPAIGAGARLLEPEDARIGRRVGAYKLISELGRGGMGTVYLALRDDAEFEHRAALKIARESVSSPALVERFRRERQILANLDHPHIARLLDGGTTADRLPYFVMEYVRGRNVVEYAVRRNLPVAARLRLFLKICDAVDYAHRQGVVHRDLKPSNVLVTDDGAPKLLDFGIAKVLEAADGENAPTLTGFHLFTPEYASPEQARGAPLSTATDIYSLGVLLYELLTTRHPFEFASRSPLEIARIVCENEPERPSTAVYRRRDTRDEPDEPAFDAAALSETSRALRGDLDNIILKAMRKEPARRYASARELADDIRRYLEHRPVTARPNGIFYRGSKFVRRHSVAAAALAVCLLMTAVGLPAVYFKFLPRSGSSVRKDAARRLTFDAAPDDFPRFTADGRIVFTRLRDDAAQLFSIAPDGGDERVFAENLPANRIYPAPDGRHLAFRSNADNRIYVTDADRREFKQVTRYRAGRVAWAPDSQSLVFSYNFGEDLSKPDEPFYRERDNVEIFRVNADGTGERDLTNNPAFDSDASFSPDGREIVFVSDRDGNFEICVMNADGSNPRRLTHNGFDDTKPAWSPDGRRIAFTTNRDGDEEIYIMDADGSNPRRLTDALGDDREPQWSPDGRRIVFSAAGEGNKEIYIIDVF